MGCRVRTALIPRCLTGTLRSRARRWLKPKGGVDEAGVDAMAEAGHDRHAEEQGVHGKRAQEANRVQKDKAPDEQQATSPARGPRAA